MSGAPRWGAEGPKHLLAEGSLWVMIAAPSVWAAHFLLCYWAAALWCAKAPETADWAGVLRLGLGALTVAALLAVGLLAHHARRTLRARLLVPDELTDDTERERARFLGNATLLLCTLSAVAVLFTATPLLVFDRCF